MLEKIGKKISSLNRMGKSVPTYTRCLIYKSIAASHFEYCASLIINMDVTYNLVRYKKHTTGQ